MINHYEDYYWKNGKPYGKGLLQTDHQGHSYKIVVDPYYKRFSVEKYSQGGFEKIIYDSLLLDFRHLTAKDQYAWEKSIIEETPKMVRCLLRNQDDRAILIETHEFTDHRCRSCTLHSVHGVLLSKHCMYYRDLQDPFDGIILWDVEERPVMKKTYAIDPQTGEFGELLLEEWNMEEASLYNLPLSQ